MKVVFVNRYFYPDHSATSQLLTELAFDLAATGMVVHVIASGQRYDDPQAVLQSAEDVLGVHVLRIWTTRFGRTRLLGRSLDYLTFYLSAGAALAKMLRRGDIVVAKTDPPLISVVAAVVARCRGAQLINWLQDVFPEVAERLGVRMFQGSAGKIARRLRDFAMQRAAITVVLGDRMAEEVCRGQVSKDRVRIIHNWADGEKIKPIDWLTSTLRDEWDLGGRFVISYSGNMGRAHEFDTVLDAIEGLRHVPELLFLFIGGGNQAGWIRAEVVKRGLCHSVSFYPYQPKDRLAESLGAAQVHLVTLQPSLEGLIVPSKFYGIAAAGRATLFVGDPKGEIPSMLLRHECGFAIAPGDVEGLMNKILALKADTQLCGELGRNARRSLLEHYDRRRAVAQWSAVLDEVAFDANTPRFGAPS